MLSPTTGWNNKTETIASDRDTIATHVLGTFYNALVWHKKQEFLKTLQVNYSFTRIKVQVLQLHFYVRCKATRSNHFNVDFELVQIVTMVIAGIGDRLKILGFFP